jgi:hypothetical protein
MKRVPQAVLIVSTLVGSWLGMQHVHELGHVAAAWLTGGRVAKVVLDPFTISRTDVAENPRPLLVVWGGPILGVLLPLAIWLGARTVRLPGTFVLRFFAGFCLIANGCYLGTGSFTHIGDAGDMLHHGAARWHLWLFAALTVPSGLWLWNGLGPEFGLGKSNGSVDPKVAYAMLACCIALVAMGIAVGS